MSAPRVSDLAANPRALSDVMEFDHVIEVHDDGTVTDGPAGVCAPELHGAEGGGTETIEGWTLVTAGYTGQDRYNGPIMHNSEVLAGRLAEDILGTPGVYVALVCYWPDDESSTDEDGPYAEGWAVARLDRDEPGDLPNGTCDMCGAPIGDAPPGDRRYCPTDPRHDCYGDRYNNGGDPIRDADGNEIDPASPAGRLADLRRSIHAEDVSYGELAELADLTPHIDPGDVELLEWAGVPEFPEEADDRIGTLYANDGDGRQTDRPLAWFHPADDEAVQTVLGAPLDDNGRSEWRWYRLVNGDLILGIAPHGDTYFAVEADAETPR